MRFFSQGGGSGKRSALADSEDDDSEDDKPLAHKQKKREGGDLVDNVGSGKGKEHVKKQEPQKGHGGSSGGAHAMKEPVYTQTYLETPRESREALF